MDVETLEFEALERRVAEYTPPIPVMGKTRWERWSAWIALLGFAVAWMAPRVITGAAGTWIGLVAAVVEVVAVVVFVVTSLRSEIPQFIDAKRKFAAELDTDYDEYERLIAWLRRFPAEDVRRRLSYVQGRRDSMADRFGLAIGGMHRLGVLPLVGALLLQFKDGFDSLSIGLWQGILIAFLMLMYAGSWWLVGLKLRLDLYARLLEDAVLP